MRMRMKRLLSVCPGIPLLFLAMLIYSCSNPIQGWNSQIIGTWQSENALRTYYFDGSGTCTLTIPAAEVGILATPPVWVTNTSYSVGAYVTPVIPIEQVYQCVKAGVSGIVEPIWIWDLKNKPTNMDGTVEWVASPTYTDIGNWSVSGSEITLIWKNQTPMSETYTIYELSQKAIRLIPPASSVSLDLYRN